MGGGGSGSKAFDFVTDGETRKGVMFVFVY